MEKVLLHCPMNISRAFSNLIREFIQTDYSDSDTEFEVYDEPHRLGSEDTLLASVKEGRPPALYIGHATDFGRLTKVGVVIAFYYCFRSSFSGENGSNGSCHKALA